MSETEDQVIKELLEEMKNLKAHNAELHKKVHRRNWFSKEMIGVYAGIVAGIVAWGNTWLDTRDHRDHEHQEQSKKVETRRFVDTTLLRYVDGQIEGVYETCDMYLDVVMSVMSPYQRRKAERRLMGDSPAPPPDPTLTPARPRAEKASAPQLYRDLLEGNAPLEDFIQNRARSLHKKR